jgi:hypothetical protein
MRFGDLPFTGGHIRNNMENVLKVYKEYNKIQTRHEPKGGRPIYLKNQGPVM